MSYEELGSSFFIKKRFKKLGILREI